MTPIHTHDCTSCILLGQAKGMDIYIHIDHDAFHNSTVILRDGSDGPDYYSMPYRYLQRDIRSMKAVWLYALGLVDGYRRALEDGLVQRGIDVAAEIIKSGDNA